MHMYVTDEHLHRPRIILAATIKQNRNEFQSFYPSEIAALPSVFCSMPGLGGSRACPS